MPANDALVFDGGLVEIRSAHAQLPIDAPGGERLLLDIGVTGPAEMVEAFIGGRPLSVELISLDALRQVREEIRGAVPPEELPESRFFAPGEPRPPMPPNTPARVLEIKLSVAEATVDRYALRLQIDPSIPANCSHHYYFSANWVTIGLISQNNNPDLQLCNYISGWGDYATYMYGDGYVEYLGGSDQKWLLRVYGQNRSACSYDLSVGLSGYRTIADN